MGEGRDVHASVEEELCSLNILHQFIMNLSPIQTINKTNKKTKTKNKNDVFLINIRVRDVMNGRKKALTTSLEGIDHLHQRTSSNQISCQISYF